MPSDARAAQFMHLFSRHEARVHAYVLSLLHDFDATQEVTQETYGILWAKFDDFEPGSNFFAWACKVARLEVMRHRRQSRRLGARLSDAAIDAITDRTIAMAEELAERERVLAECVDRLTEKDADLIRRRYTQGATTRQVATAVGRSAEAVYKSLGRIRRSLHACIERRLRGEGPA